MNGGEEDVPLTGDELRLTLKTARDVPRTWPLELQAKMIWLREFSGQPDGPSLPDVLAALEAADEVEAVRR